MLMPPRVRKAALLLHAGTSVGLLGTIASFFVLAIVGVLSGSVLAARGAYLSMNVIAFALVLPLAVLGLLSGFVVALGTRWGLIRHWWVAIKLILTLFSIVVLLLRLPLVHDAAHLAAEASDVISLRRVGVQLVIHSGGGLLTLLVAFVLSIYKPAGVTRWTPNLSRSRRNL